MCGRHCLASDCSMSATQCFLCVVRTCKCMHFQLQLAMLHKFPEASAPVVLFLIVNILLELDTYNQCI